MSFNGNVKVGDRVVLLNKDGAVVHAASAMDKEFQWGGLAAFEVDILKGMPGIDRMTVNVNYWDVYREDDPKLAPKLLEAIFKGKN